MDRFELYRLLAADQLDLLDPAGKQALQDALRLHPDVDGASFAARVREALASGADLEAFVAAIERADREGAAPAPPVRSARRWRNARVAVAAFAAALVLWAGARWLQDRGEGPGLSVRLDATRGADVPALDLDAAAGGRVTLVVDVRTDARELAWEIRDTALAPVASGTLAVEGAAPGARTVAVVVATGNLRAGAGYWLVLTTPGGETVGQWRFDTE